MIEIFLMNENIHRVTMCYFCSKNCSIGVIGKFFEKGDGPSEEKRVLFSIHVFFLLF